MALTLVLIDPGTALGSDPSTRWDTFSESSGCGDPLTATPFATRQGGLSDAELILGPYGTYFGRSVSEIRTNLVPWAVPGSGGRVVQVHRAMVPALQQVAARLSAEAANGRVYAITSVGAFNPRTIRGSHRMSRHAMGLAIDINPATNPHTSGNQLVSDMPEWFVQIWRDAGFCWGGDWRNSKDAMHFSWMGPGAGNSAVESLIPRPPATTKTAFGQVSVVTQTPYGSATDRYSINVADGNGNGAPDVVGVRDHPDGAVIAVASSTRGHGECSVFRWFVPDIDAGDAEHIVFGDVDADSGQDLIAFFDNAEAEGVTSVIATRRAGFENATFTGLTGLSQGSAALATADFDGDRIADVWEITPEGELRIWRGPTWIELIHEDPLPGVDPVAIAAGDRDGGDTPELYAVTATEAGTQLHVMTWNGAWVLEDSFALGLGPEGVVSVGAGDYDGDGRSDFQIVDQAGNLTVYMGNSSTGAPPNRWFERPDWECGDNEIDLDYDGTFADDDDSIFQIHIESLARSGVTQGCNPPYRDLYCPEHPVSRAEMAAFLVRGLALEQNSHSGFADVDPGGIFAEDIGRLATAGITLGCGQDEFCPNDPVSRAQMASFLVRALALGENTHPGFLDVDGASTFAVDIGRLATAGITNGCTIAGDRFCPDDIVTREAMAGFLDRAGLGDMQ